MQSKVTIFGHSVHPMLVAFPIAFYSAALASYGVYACTDDVFVFRVGVVANVAGVVGAVLAAIPGFIDWAFAIPGGHPAKATGLQHMLVHVFALILFAISAWVGFNQWDLAKPSATSLLVLSSVGMAFTLVGGFLGWAMVQKHHMGIDLTERQKRIDVVREARQTPDRADQITTRLERR